MAVAVEVFQVLIPYTVDSSPWRDVIQATFSPEIDQLAAGDVIAVKVANTNYGPTTVFVNSLPGIQMHPNGGGMMLQGDVHAGDIVLMFYDGQHFFFTPNPEINQWVMYTVGHSQQFATTEECLDAIRRKTIGAGGFVHIQLSEETFYAPVGKYAVIEIDHASSDRIAIVGTMIGPALEWWEFRATGSDANTQSMDAVFNASMLRTRYGTILQLPWRAEPETCAGIYQSGPGRPSIRDILIVGNRPAMWSAGWGENGVQTWDDSALKCYNVTVWGCAMGFRADGARIDCDNCWSTGNTHWGYSTGARAYLSLYFCGSFGNGQGGVSTHHASFSWVYNSYTLCNGSQGVCANGAAVADTWYHTSLGNGIWDYYASTAGVINSCWTLAVGTTSPDWNTTGNLNGLIALHQPIEFVPPPK